MRSSSHKSRGTLPFPTSSDNAVSNSSKPDHLNTSREASSKFYEVPELAPVTSTSGIDVYSLTDDEVRERFKSVMVSICFVFFFIDNIRYFNIIG